MVGLTWSTGFLLAGFMLTLATASLFAFDKRRAKLGGRRIPERTLLAWSLAGGWVGGAMAMRALRHKTRKRAFLWRFWAAAFVSATLWVAAWLLAR